MLEAIERSAGRPRPSLRLGMHCGAGPAPHRRTAGVTCSDSDGVAATIRSRRADMMPTTERLHALPLAGISRDHHDRSTTSKEGQGMRTTTTPHFRISSKAGARLGAAILLASALRGLSAGDALSIDPTGTVLIGNATLGRSTPAAATEIVRGDDPRLQGLGNSIASYPEAIGNTITQPRASSFTGADGSVYSVSFDLKDSSGRFMRSVAVETLAGSTLDMNGGASFGVRIGFTDAAGTLLAAPPAGQHNCLLTAYFIAPIHFHSLQQSLGQSVGVGSETATMTLARNGVTPGTGLNLPAANIAGVSRWFLTSPMRALFDAAPGAIKLRINLRTSPADGMHYPAIKFSVFYE